MSPPTVVRCPICGRAVRWMPEERWRPFCSERCKLIDLGQWAQEQYRIAGEDSASPSASTDDPFEEKSRES